MKLNDLRHPIARPRPGMPPGCTFPKPAPGRQDDGIHGPGGKPKPRQPQPGDIYIGGPNPQGQKQYDAKDLQDAGAKISRPFNPDAQVSKGHNPDAIKAGGPFKLDEAFSIQKFLNQ